MKRCAYCGHHCTGRTCAYCKDLPELERRYRDVGEIRALSLRELVDVLANLGPVKGK